MESILQLVLIESEIKSCKALCTDYCLESLEYENSG